jgi:NAD(P)H-dependent FMN reductase
MILLFISGSLRHQSKNSALLRALAKLAPADVSILHETGLGALPHFNPDLEGPGENDAPLAVLDYRQRLRAADGVVICSPEYAHGIPGAMKNALDWVVGSGELVGKPCAVFNLSPLSTHAHAGLMEVLRTMSARPFEWIAPFALSGANIDEDVFLAHATYAPALKTGLDEFVKIMASRQDKS